MFSIFTPEGEPWYSSERRVADCERNVFVQVRNTTGKNPGNAFVLKHGEMTVPFNTAELSHPKDPVTGKNYFVSQIVSFGSSLYLKGDRNVPDYDFTSDEEAQKWRRIAVEALLVFGRAYDGFDYAPDQIRVLADNEIFTRRDFGYDK